ncbi:hypothetical protein, partial [Holdemania massiliensis]|uniref:hypothetical protein n=1 Tax=Holdemania massiliensis TaxID=1468449 RepID=UPI003569BF03
TEVKHFRGENSYACHSEGSSLPGSSAPLMRESFFLLVLTMNNALYRRLEKEENECLQLMNWKPTLMKIMCRL